MNHRSSLEPNTKFAPLSLMGKLATLLITAALALFVETATAAGKVIHKERSLYRTVLVVQDRERTCMQFSVREDQRNQSCKDRKDSKRLVFEYAKLVFAGLLLSPEPKNILVVGLGGGTLPTAFRELLPNARIDVVEIDQAVVSVARDFFDYAATPPGKLYVQDARIFGKRAAKKELRYDLILLDAFNGDYIPEHLMTREYLLETQELLASDGVLLANTFSISDLYHHENATYESVFGKLLTVQSPESANRVIVAKKGALPTDGDIDRNLERWTEQLAPYDVDLPSIRAKINDRRDWNLDARVLTDQYSPANLLQR